MPFPTFTDQVDLVDDVKAININPIYAMLRILAVMGDEHNFIINADFRVAQRGTSFTAATVPLNSDDTYLLDRFILLSDGNDIVDVTQEATVVPTGIKNAIKLEVETPNKQFGILTILENKDAKSLIGNNVSLSFQARMAAVDDNTHSLKAVILSWDGAADTVTSDVVNAWLATPTYVANWTAENTPASNTLTTSYQTFKIENVAIDTASTTNVAVFIFCDQTDGVVDDAVYITGIKLELGEVATTFTPRMFAQELNMCKRYYEMIRPGIAYAYYAMGYVSVNVTANYVLFYTEKRNTPASITISDVTAFEVGYAATNTATTNLTAAQLSTRSCHLTATTDAVLTVGDATLLFGENSTSTHWIGISAEL